MATDDMFATKTSKPVPGKADRDGPLSNDEKVDIGSEDSMDASDPPAVVSPGDHGEPMPSSGFDEAQENARGQD